MIVALPLSAVVSAALCAAFIPLLRRSGMLCEDHNKKIRRTVPQMGGLAVILGFCGGVLLCISFDAFLDMPIELDSTALLAATSTVLMIGFIGLIDDLLGMPQIVKAVTPSLAALPLIAVRSGVSVMSIPFLGPVDFGVLYILLFVPLGVTGAANAINILAGFDGLEAGMGLIAFASLSVIAWHLEAWAALALLLAGLGSIVGFLFFNWYPARLFLGDIGALTIGSIIAAATIIGNFEIAGILVIIPHAIDLGFKAANRFPTDGWQGVLGDDGKLHCPEHGPVGLCQFLLKVSGGLHERTLVLTLMAAEAVVGIAAAAVYVFR